MTYFCKKNNNNKNKKNKNTLNKNQNKQIIQNPYF